MFDFKIWFLFVLFFNKLKLGWIWWVAILIFFNLLYNFKFFRVMVNDKMGFFTEVVKQQSICNFPSGQSFGSGTFFNKYHL